MRSRAGNWIDGPDHALLQLVRLEGAHELVAEAVQGGDLKAIGPYLKLARGNRPLPKAGARKEVYDAARAKNCSPRSPRRRPDRSRKARKAAKESRRRAARRSAIGDAPQFLT